MRTNLGAMRPAVVLRDMQEVPVSASGPFENVGAASVVEALNAFPPRVRRLDMPDVR